MKSYGNHCAYCDVAITSAKFDFIIPLEDGGDTHFTNFQPLCQDCFALSNTGDSNIETMEVCVSDDNAIERKSGVLPPVSAQQVEVVEVSQSPKIVEQSITKVVASIPEAPIEKMKHMADVAVALMMQSKAGSTTTNKTSNDSDQVRSSNSFHTVKVQNATNAKEASHESLSATGEVISSTHSDEDIKLDIPLPLTEQPPPTTSSTSSASPVVSSSSRLKDILRLNASKLDILKKNLNKHIVDDSDSSGDNKYSKKLKETDDDFWDDFVGKIDH